MAPAPGTRLGPYAITAPLGAGGMGEVYKATDTRLDRIVAIKVLPEHVADDPDLRQRFEREAKTLAALSHPHICPVFDVGRQDGIDYLVMEHLEGETLAQRLSKGALPVDQALQVAIQIADALDKAHRQGIVHRDLKPGNIMLTRSGARLLDFGLAKLRPASAAGGGVVSEAPTISSPLTGAGLILGTFQYMAPEQLEGHEADARTDIFAFGAVVYEMITGKKAFEGKSQASLIGAILEGDPAPMSSLQPLSPAALDRVVKKWLAKEPGERWQTTKDLHDELQWVASAAAAEAGAATAMSVSRPGAGWRLGVVLLATLCAGLAIAGGTAWLAMRATRPVVVRMEVTTPSGAALNVNTNQRSIAVTPDGSRIIYVGTDRADREALFVRALGELAPRTIPEFNESGARLSPGDQWMAYQSDESGRSEVYVRPYPNVQAGRFQVSTEGGGTPRWSRDGRELFYLSPDDVLMAVRMEPGPAWRTSTPMRLISRRSQYLALDVSTDGQRFLMIKEAAGGASAIRNLVVVQHFDEELKRLVPGN